MASSEPTWGGLSPKPGGPRESSNLKWGIKGYKQRADVPKHKYNSNRMHPMLVMSYRSLRVFVIGKGSANSSQAKTRRQGSTSLPHNRNQLPSLDPHHRMEHQLCPENVDVVVIRFHLLEAGWIVAWRLVWSSVRGWSWWQWICVIEIGRQCFGTW